MERGRRIGGLKGSWEWLQFAAQLPANAIVVPATPGGLQVVTGRCIYAGLTLINAATTAGRIVVYDGMDTTGAIVDAAAVAASGIASVNAAPVGLLCEIGIFLQVTTATVSGSIAVVPLWHYDFTPPGT